MTVTVRVATVRVPERCAVVVLAATLYDTVPFPEPLLPLVIVSHVALLVAVHAQPVVVVTAVDAVPPAAAID